MRSSLALALLTLASLALAPSAFAQDEATAADLETPAPENWRGVYLLSAITLLVVGGVVIYWRKRVVARALSRGPPGRPLSARMMDPEARPIEPAPAPRVERAPFTPIVVTPPDPDDVVEAEPAEEDDDEKEEPAPTPRGWPEVIAAAKPSIVLVRAGNSIGTGFAIGERVLVTNDHVVAGHDEVVLDDSDGNSYPATVFWRGGPNCDLAMLRTPGHAWVPLPARATPVVVGEKVLAIGHPNNRGWTPSDGIVAGIHPRGDWDEVQLTASINPGNSGGPVLDEQGFVVAVVFSRDEESSEGRRIEGIGHSIAIDAALRHLRGRTSGKRPRATPAGPQKSS